jgi:SAM-dependent methyltransferase
MTREPRDILAEQQTYYRERAPEYDEYFTRAGRYDEGPERNRAWFAEVDDVRAALAAFAPTGEVLELAAGTGWWTAELLRYAERLTALDGSPEALAVNRDKLGADPRLEYVLSDIFSWVPERAYDAVFFGFWLSHVPPQLFDAFWARVRSFLRPRGRVFFVDSLQPSTVVARARARDSDVTVRQLNDGREFRVVKIFYEPEALEEKLRGLGWEAEVRATPTYFVYGAAR